MADAIQKILVVAPNWLGDAAMCTPALRVLDKRFPEAEITVAGRAPACALLAGLPWFHAFVRLPDRPNLFGLLGLGRRLLSQSRDLAVVFPHGFRAALLARLSGAARRLGYDRDHRAMLLTDAIQPYRENGRIQPIYMAKEYVDLLGCLGCEDDGEGLELCAAPEAVAAVCEHLVGDGPVVGIAAGAAFGPSKWWPAERYGRLADMLEERAGARCVLLTGPGEEETRDAVQAAARRPLIECDGGRPTIDALKAAVSQLDLLVGNDLGPRHVAVAFKVPTVCIMGPTSPRYSNGPYERGRVLRIDVDCGPCQKPECTTDHRCMAGISVEDVAAAALDILGRHV